MKEKAKEKESGNRNSRKRNIIGVTVSLVLLAAILLIAFFVTPILSQQTSGSILPDNITTLVIDSGNAKIEIGSRSDIETIQYYLSGSAEMRWKVDGGTLLIKAEEGSLRVSVPHSLRLDMIRVKSTEKDIEINDVKSRMMELENGEDDIRLWNTRTDNLSAKASGSFRTKQSVIKHADIEAEKNIELEESELGSVVLSWTDGSAEVRDSQIGTLDAYSPEGRLEVMISNGLREVRINGKAQEIFPVERDGAEISWTTDKGDFRCTDRSVRPQD